MVALSGFKASTFPKMAYFKYPPLFLLFQVPLLLSLFSPHYQYSSTFVRGDGDLVHKICNQTGNPVTCNACLGSDPRSNSSDVKGLTIIVIDCAVSQTSLVRRRIDQILPNITDTPSLVALHLCRQLFYYAGNDIQIAVPLIESGDYLKATGAVKFGLLDSDKCVEQFRGSPLSPDDSYYNIIKLPTPLADDINTFTCLVDIAVAVIHLLPC